MSVLDKPRVYFKGEIAWDPVTTNNYGPPDSGTFQAAAAYDEDACTPLLNNAPFAAKVAAFRQTAVDEIVSAGSWNPHGSYRSPFFNTAVSGVDAGNGLDTDDPFVSAPVNFTGMLIDSEPYGAWSSQLFFDDIAFGIAGGCHVSGRRSIRLNDRFINFNANPANNMIAGIASVMWQTCFAKDDGLVIDPHNSGVLAALARAMDDPAVAGLMLRFTTYRTIYYDDPTLANRSPAAAAAGAALQAKIRAGGFQPNPARSLLVGTLGLWRRDEVPTEACERALVSTMATIPGFNSPTLQTNAGPAVGTAFARVGAAGIALDLSNAIPCADRAGEKIDIGTLELVAADPAPAVAITTVATIPFSHYDRAAYEATSGIVDIPLAPALAAQLAGMDLSIKGPDGTTYLQEAPLRAVPSMPNLYANQGDRAHVEVQVYQRGAVAPAGVAVVMSDMAATQATHLAATTDADGRVQFALETGTPTVDGLVFQAGPDPVLPIGNAFNPLIQTYMYLRVLPQDEKIAALAPTWDNVHTYVLSSWEAMAPCMDNWLRLGDEAQVLAYAPIIRKLTDPANFEAFRYMPPTRDLTVGQRSLLYRFLDQGAGAVQAGTTEPDRVDIHKLSRAMRST
ncbi:hypothetical protein [Novosphingobium sp. FSW06-99]|uniref:hypothetical protein n=1 Tax=Novosphingobium sp. FSW06-99 TaxID=1739113 RepID=UPI00076D1364|nr:hypothetical protein [Novosphingobium sp. FSW06-99]KUR78203.1 hypothetical protein AQZ49_07670 [Novosphingobium sp. FSW06-99]